MLDGAGAEELAAEVLAAAGSAAATGIEYGGDNPSLAAARAEAVGMATLRPRVGSAAFGSTSQTPAV